MLAIELDRTVEIGNGAIGELGVARPRPRMRRRRSDAAREPA
jgi:hypothetical protein